MFATFVWVDWAIVTVMTLSVLSSYRKGFCKEVTSLLTWVTAVFMVWVFSTSLSGYLMAYIDQPTVRVLVAAVVLFLGTMFVGGLLNRFLQTLAKPVRGTDQLLGMLVGCAKGGVLVVLIAALADKVLPEEETVLQDSVLLPHILLVADWSREVVLDWFEPGVSA